MFRKSSKQRRAEIKAARLNRAKKLSKSFDVYRDPMPHGAVAADQKELNHNSPFALLPLYYMDRAFRCRDCGSHEVWTAKQQKWWYEIAKGNIDSTAIRCRSCRKIERERKADARRVHLEGLARKHGQPNA